VAAVGYAIPIRRRAARHGARVVHRRVHLTAVISAVIAGGVAVLVAALFGRTCGDSQAQERTADIEPEGLPVQTPVLVVE
jgi:hypothetical protein